MMPGHRQRQRHVEERLRGRSRTGRARPRPAIVEPVDRDVQRQDRERQEPVGHAQHDGQVGVEQDDRLVDDPERRQHRVHHAVVAQDDHPGVGPDEVARPERQHHEDQQQRLVAPAVAADPVRDRVADQDREHRRQRRVPERVPDRRQERRRQRARVVVERQVVAVHAAEPVLRAQADDEDDRQRHEEEQAPASRSPGRTSGPGAQAATHRSGGSSSAWRTCRGRRRGRAARPACRRPPGPGSPSGP